MKAAELETRIGQTFTVNGGPPTILLDIDTINERFSCRFTKSVTVYSYPISAFEKFDIVWLNDTKVTKPVPNPFPHQCPKCRMPAYVGLMTVDCSRGCR